MGSLGKINLEEECPNHPFVTGCILLGQRLPPTTSKELNSMKQDTAKKDEVSKVNK